jgi:hypothetical protein
MQREIPLHYFIGINMSTDSPTFEFDEEVQALTVAVEALQIKLRDLDFIRNTIDTQGGISQTIALEAQVLIPDFINDSRPINFFTKHVGFPYCFS